jgi:hypothetical protein
LTEGSPSSDLTFPLSLADLRDDLAEIRDLASHLNAIAIADLPDAN